MEKKTLAALTMSTNCVVEKKNRALSIFIFGKKTKKSKQNRTTNKNTKKSTPKNKGCSLNECIIQGLINHTRAHTLLCTRRFFWWEKIYVIFILWMYTKRFRRIRQLQYNIGVDRSIQISLLFLQISLHFR